MAGPELSMEEDVVKITAARPRMDRTGRAWAYLTLTRPANVVTALADVLAGAAAAGTVAGLPGLLLSTAALYAGGVVLNDVFDAVEKQPQRSDAFRYNDDDRFPLAAGGAVPGGELGLVAAGTERSQAAMVADEIARLLSAGTPVRDRMTGAPRPIGPGDIAILFRTREGHRLIEEALSERGVPFYVYKGLGFFDADEIKDVLALLGFLANPASDLRAAALLRSRFIRISDTALKLLAPELASALTASEPPAATMLTLPSFWIDSCARAALT